ncbi:MAG: VWA domain-containing protein, partial [Acidobacteriota bacterium]
MLLRHARVGLPLALLLLAANLSAQEAALSGEAPEGAFFETVDVNVVNIEVFVYDKKGDPITGLTREDFEVFEDGDRVEVTNFYAVDDGRPVGPTASDATPEATDAPREPRLSDRIPRIPESQRLHLVVYVDNFNIEPFHRNRVFGQLRSFLRGLDRQDRVMLVSYDRSLNIRHRFTDEPGKIAEALFDL